MIGNDRSGHYVSAIDAGRDQIFVWKLDQATGKLSKSRSPSHCGIAPRHFVFSPTTRPCPASGAGFRLQVYDFRTVSDGGAFVSALPDGYEGSNTDRTADRQRRKHIYFANRTRISLPPLCRGGRRYRIAKYHTAQQSA